MATVTDEYMGDAGKIIQRWFNSGYTYVTIPGHHSAPCTPHREEPAGVEPFDLRTAGGKAVATLWVAATLSIGVPYE